MRKVLLIAVLALAGCNQEEPENVLLKSERRALATSPPGRYVMLPAKDAEGIYILDTRRGIARFCRPKHDQEGMGCGPAAGF